MSEMDFPYIVFSVEKIKFAMSSEYILNISTLSEVFGIEQAGDVFRGMTKITGQVVRLLDLRVVLGRTSKSILEQTFISTIEKAKDAHVVWMQALESAVQNHTEFALATDPHACAFGKWYDGYQAENQYLKRALAKIAMPHTRLHNSAKKIIQLSKTEQYDKMERELEETRRICHEQILPLLDDVIAEYRDADREMVLHVKKPMGEIGILVDEIYRIGNLTELSTELAAGGVGSEFAKAVAKDEEGDTVLLLDEDLLLSRYAAMEG